LIRVIDIETTGTDPSTDEIIEIASADMVRGGGITNAMDTLVRPSRPIPLANGSSGIEQGAPVKCSHEPRAVGRAGEVRPAGLDRSKPDCLTRSSASVRAVCPGMLATTAEDTARLPRGDAALSFGLQAELDCCGRNLA
jgi:exonuclease